MRFRLLTVKVGVMVLAWLAGCTGTHGPAPSAPGQGVVIGKGMKIEAARKALEAGGVALVEDRGSYSRNPWVVRSPKSVDALVAELDERNRIEWLYWYVDWQHDRAQPKGERKFITEDVAGMTVEEIGRWVERGVRPG